MFERSQDIVSTFTFVNDFVTSDLENITNKNIYLNGLKVKKCLATLFLGYYLIDFQISMRDAAYHALAFHFTMQKIGKCFQALSIIYVFIKRHVNLISYNSP